jgi:hypothetical protein
MNATQLTQIHASVAAALRANPARAQARDLLEWLASAAGPAVGSVHPFQLRVAVALCALGPHAPPPPVEAFDRFARVADRETQGRTDDILDVAIGYGCGLWRDLERARGPWFDEWGGAVAALARLAEPAVLEVLKWLSGRLPGLPGVDYWRSDEGRSIVRRDAGLLAITLLRPLEPLHTSDEGERLDITCSEGGTSVAGSAGAMSRHLPPGNRLLLANGRSDMDLSCAPEGDPLRSVVPRDAVVSVLAVDDGTHIRPPSPVSKVTLGIDQEASLAPAAGITLWTCGCGNRNCATRHRLHAWRPAVVALRSFVASAVKGPERNLKAGVFVAGMYFPVLSRFGIENAGRLRVLAVEYSYCQTPACLAQGRQYEGDRCPTCHRAFDPATTPRRAIARIELVRDAALYERVERFACAGHGGNLYDGAACPICGGVAKLRRPTAVWIRTASREESIDADPALMAQVVAIEAEPRDIDEDADMAAEDHAFL